MVIAMKKIISFFKSLFVFRCEKLKEKRIYHYSDCPLLSNKGACNCDEKENETLRRAGYVH